MKGRHEYRDFPRLWNHVLFSTKGVTMTNAELKEYLNGFPDGAQVSVILANPKKRKLYEVDDAMCITDFDQPVFCIEV